MSTLDCLLSQLLSCTRQTSTSSPKTQGSDTPPGPAIYPTKKTRYRETAHKTGNPYLPRCFSRGKPLGP